MRFATVPADIALFSKIDRKPVMIVDPDSTPEPGQPPKLIPEVLSFRRYAHAFWLQDRRWHGHIKGLVKVLDEIEKAPGEVMCFEDADFDVLKGIVEKPFTAQDGSIALPSPMLQMQLEPFPDAISHASSKHPLGAAAAETNGAPKPKAKQLPARA